MKKEEDNILSEEEITTAVEYDASRMATPLTKQQLTVRRKEDGKNFF